MPVRPPVAPGSGRCRRRARRTTRRPPVGWPALPANPRAPGRVWRVPVREAGAAPGCGPQHPRRRGSRRTRRAGGRASGRLQRARPSSGWTRAVPGGWLAGSLRYGAGGEKGGARVRAAQVASRLRPLRRRPAKMARPARVRIRRRKPCVLLRLRLFGWNVRLLTGGLRGSTCGMLRLSRLQSSVSAQPLIHTEISRHIYVGITDSLRLWTCGTSRHRCRLTYGTGWRRDGSNQGRRDAGPTPNPQPSQRKRRHDTPTRADAPGWHRDLRPPVENPCSGMPIVVSVPSARCFSPPLLRRLAHIRLSGAPQCAQPVDNYVDVALLSTTRARSNTMGVRSRDDSGPQPRRRLAAHRRGPPS